MAYLGMAVQDQLQTNAGAACFAHLLNVDLLGAVDAAEVDTLRVGVVQNLDGVAGEDGDNGADEVSQARNGNVGPDVGIGTYCWWSETWAGVLQANMAKGILLTS